LNCLIQTHPEKNVEFEILLTQPHTLDSIPNGPDKFDNHDRLGWPRDQRDQTDLTTQTSRVDSMTQTVWVGGPDDPDGRGDLMTHMGRAGLTTQTGRSSSTTIPPR